MQFAIATLLTTIASAVSLQEDASLDVACASSTDIAEPAQVSFPNLIMPLGAPPVFRRHLVEDNVRRFYELDS